MHDIRAIRENPTAFDAGFARRGMGPQSQGILAIDQARRLALHTVETQKAEMNFAAKAIGSAMAKGDKEGAEALKAGLSRLKQEISENEKLAKDEDARLRQVLETLPNLPLAEVPDGADEDDNVELKTWGTPREFDFQPVEHFEIAGIAPNMDFATAAKLSGSRFVVLRGAVARVHRALAQFMTDLHVDQHDLTEVNSPVLVRDEAMYGTGQLPKFAEDSYQTTNGWWLIPTSEVTLTNFAAGEILDGRALPLRFCAHTLCFRSEAGSAGKDTTGMLRQHQFEKVEMVSVTHPADSLAEHERMTRCAEAVLERLELPYRRIVLCTGDMGFGAQKTHDIEVWVPGQGKYREISSVSVCGDFQARRMNARFRPEDGGKPEFVHTLNGSGVAVGRCLIAVLENGQSADGGVDLPAALHRYLGGRTRITPTGDLV
ncbi:serine--tRNA ligase [Roseinatronobacter alkalisoli]|uniref:Serine--tRNA ligase n=1 Tax=Roseinatronobacter alkalisoli TaxID=3028235 RepID=A0ABT5T761_9RHOB|nr:serine--tRNA ligase [Roseinatronobacter sp. HJB301]MDD7970520.1 serine--tRNA ligase [Roseinatronobacter sp. HJB301]